jgi:hypothetical protein
MTRPLPLGEVEAQSAKGEAPRNPPKLRQPTRVASRNRTPSASLPDAARMAALPPPAQRRGPAISAGGRFAANGRAHRRDNRTLAFPVPHDITGRRRLGSRPRARLTTLRFSMLRSAPEAASAVSPPPARPTNVACSAPSATRTPVIVAPEVRPGVCGPATTRAVQWSGRRVTSRSMASISTGSGCRRHAPRRSTLR